MTKNILIDEKGTIFIETRKGVYTPEKDIKKKSDKK